MHNLSDDQGAFTQLDDDIKHNCTRMLAINNAPPVLAVPRDTISVTSITLVYYISNPKANCQSQER